MVAAARRLGWSLPSATSIVEPDGTITSLVPEAPHTVRLMARDAFVGWCASQFPRCRGTRNTYGSRLWPPLPGQVPSPWPKPQQATLFAADRATSPDCQALGGDLGTFYHRVRGCLATAPLRSTRDAERARITMGALGPGEAAVDPLLSAAASRQWTPP